jgi:ribosomal protein S18 acetylase RimI-like enzyme
MIVEIGDRKFIARKVRLSDAKAALDFINSLVEEDAPILINKKATLKEEKEWLIRQIQMEKKKQSYSLFVFDKNKMVARVVLMKGKGRKSHIAELSIAVRNGYRGIGIGKFLMKRALEIARKDKGIKIITLEVLVTNKIAIRLYKKMGFKIVARLPKRGFYKGKYIDTYVMDYYLR